MTSKNRFVLLNAIDVSDHIEKKNGLSYLSWAWAWTEFKKCFPDSYYTIYETDQGLNFFTDGKTCWVKTGVTLVDDDFQLELIEDLPIMNLSNKSIPLASVTSMDVNKAIQRSLTKAVARHGLGLYVYAGEDMPEETDEVKQKKVETEAEIVKTIAAIDVEAKRLTTGLDKTASVKFLEDNVKPVIGQLNYKTCKDLIHLTTLLDTLKSMKHAA